MSPFERGSNLSGRVFLAQRSTAERFQRRLRFISASGGGKSSRSTYRHAVRRPILRAELRSVDLESA